MAALHSRSGPRQGAASVVCADDFEFGTQLGAKGDFAGCVKGAKNAAAVTAETQKAIADPTAQTNGVFGTPTVIANGAQVNLNNTNWLNDILASA